MRPISLSSVCSCEYVAQCTVKAIKPIRASSRMPRLLHQTVRRIYFAARSRWLCHFLASLYSIFAKALMTNVEADARASKSPLSHSVFTCETYNARYTSGAMCSTSEWVFAWVALKLGENVYHFTSLPVFAQPHSGCRWGVMREHKRGKNIIRSISGRGAALASHSHSLSSRSVFAQCCFI